ncbi:MAG: C69 family dipeptidase [Lachnospiraceae bacterium]|nr:C69 family dipeptidase [Lachnospiraceae bacterium]
MACTTILVGKKASYDGSTLIARNDDGGYDTKKLVVVKPKDQPKKYKSKISHVEITLPENPMSYTACPNVVPTQGTWAACGINAANVAMTATETITTNARVLGADPLVVLKPKDGKNKEVPGGIGEEDLVVLVLPYIKSAREGVIRLGKLLKEYGTYECNGIAFSDKDEIWWLETIGGHNFIARKVKDDEYVVMPNQFGLDRFDFEDAYGEQKENMCSEGLKDLIKRGHLDLTMENGKFNPRDAFGSHDDSDHVYNTPRAWYMGRYFNPTTYKWDGENADFTPESDNIPWSFVPEKKITVEDVKYILSSYYQGTQYNPYSSTATEKGKYRPIGISRTDVMAILQIRDYVPSEIAAVEWICFASNAFNSALPVYTNTDSFPAYLSDVKASVSTENLYWSERLLGALADPHYGSAIQLVERYQKAVAAQGHRIIQEYDEKMIESGNFELIKEANKELASMAKNETEKALNNLLKNACAHMKNGYSRADN